MEQSAVSNNIEHSLERLAVKSLCAADILKNAVKIAQDLQQVQKKVSRYIEQAKLILTWKKGCGVLKMVGSASKTIGGVMVVAAPLHPKLGLAVKVGYKLWKLGTGLKVLTAVGNMLRDLWQTGIRNSLLEFIHASALLSQKLDVFGEVIQDLQSCAQSITGINVIQIPDEVFNILKPFIPHHQLDYFKHVINIAFGNRYYSPLLDFILMSSEISSTSNIVQFMREIESFHFIDFAELGDSKCLIAIGSFLHISRELLDFLDGFQKVTEQDCRFLSDCLTRFTEESLIIMKTVNVLANLHQVRAQQSGVFPKNINMQDNRDSLVNQENLSSMKQSVEAELH